MANIRQKARARRIEHDDPVRIVAHVGGDFDDGGTFELHGESGRVVGANPHYRHQQTGERMTAVELDGGAIVTVPTRALKRD